MLSWDIKLFRRKPLCFNSILMPPDILLYEKIRFSSAENGIIFNHTEERRCPDRPRMAWRGVVRMFVFIQYWRENWHSHLPPSRSASDMEKPTPDKSIIVLHSQLTSSTFSQMNSKFVLFNIFHIISILLPCCSCYKSSVYFRCMLYAPFRRLDIWNSACHHRFCLLSKEDEPACPRKKY